MENNGLALVFLLDIFFLKKEINHISPHVQCTGIDFHFKDLLSNTKETCGRRKKEKTIDLLINDLGESLSNLDCVQRIQMTSLVVSKASSSWVILIWLV